MMDPIEAVCGGRLRGLCCCKAPAGQLHLQNGDKNDDKMSRLLY
jgi:hypothetical protein